MGGHLLVSQPANMMRLLLLSAMVASGMAFNTRQMIRRDMEKFNNDAMCWGVENMMAFRLAQYKAMEECSKYGQFSTLPAPANNPFTTLPGDASNVDERPSTSWKPKKPPFQAFQQRQQQQLGQVDRPLVRFPQRTKQEAS